MKCVNGERYCEWHSEFFFSLSSNILRYFNINVIFIPLSPSCTSALICFHFRRGLYFGKHISGNFKIISPFSTQNCNFTFKSKVINAAHWFCCFAGVQAPLHSGNKGGWPRRLLPPVSKHPLPSQPPATQLQQPRSPHLPGEPPGGRAAAV